MTDRIIFLRMAEDRGVEDYGRLMALLNGKDGSSSSGYLWVPALCLAPPTSHPPDDHRS